MWTKYCVSLQKTLFVVESVKMGVGSEISTTKMRQIIK